MRDGQGKAERAGAVKPGEEKAREISSMYDVSVPEERFDRGWSQALSSGAQHQDKRQWAKTGTQEVPS